VGLHLYAGAWLARSFGAAPRAAALLRTGLLLLAFFAPLTMYLKRQHHNPALEPLYYAGYAWMGLIVISTSVLACADLAAFFARRAGLPWGPAQARLALAAAAALAAWAFYGGARVPQIKRLEIAVPGLPPHLDGLRIAQISDMHVDSHLKLRQYAAVVDKINSEEPDLVAVTGDLIDPGITCQEEVGEATARLRSRLGIFGVPGNHEYYYGLDKALDCYRAFGIKTLLNSGTDAGGLRIVGLGDIRTEGASEDEVLRVIRKYSAPDFTLLLTHQPLYYEEVSAAGKFVGLSGHTHRGQLFPFHFLTRAVYRYFYGLYQVGGSSFYVTSGTGTWGPPLRLLAPAEIPLITLRRV
jgi:uncharacterized protein